MQIRYVILFILISWICVIESRCVNRFIVMEALSPNYDAVIFGYSSDVVLSWGFELMVIDKKTKDVVKRVLLFDKRDSSDELNDEIVGLSFIGRSVKLEGKFNHYKGDTIIKF
jgi:hypothetical protein